MTYRRLKIALEDIARGCTDPVDIAKEALRNRRPIAKPKEPKPPAKPNGRPREWYLNIFEEWLSNNRPTYVEFAKKHGLTTSVMNRALHKGARIWGYTEGRKFRPWENSFKFFK